MGLKFWKHGYLDKYDAHIISIPNFIQDSYGVSAESSEFHNTTAYGYAADSGPGFRYGVCKKLHKISGHGIVADGEDVGKSSKN